MAQDVTGPIDPDRLFDRTFSTVRRGVDPAEVEAYLRQIAEQMRAMTTRLGEMERELDARRARATSGDPVDPIDPSNLTKLVGEETARVLDAAQGAAAEIRARAEENVARMLRDAREEVSRLREDAETIVARRTEEAEIAASAVRDRAEIDRARAEAEIIRIIEDAKQRGRDMLAEAHQVRQRMLDDLARRRQGLREQIEQLQASRDRLAAAYDVVRDTLAVATEELQVALPDERLAAETASLRAAEAELEATITPITAVEDTSGVHPAAPGPPPDPRPPHLTVVPPVEESTTDVTEESDAPSTTGPAPSTTGASVAPVRPGAPSRADAPTTSSARRGPSAVEPGGSPAHGGTGGDPDSGPTPDAPAETRQSSSVRVVRAGKAADVFARLREEGAAEAAEQPAAVVTAKDDPSTTARSKGTDRSTSGTAIGQKSGNGQRTTGGADHGDPSTEPPQRGADVDAATDAANDPGLDVDATIGVDDQDFIASRDAAVEAIVSSLTRRIKRELSDEQNELLASVGAVKGNPTAIALLPTPESEFERFEDLALPALADAAAAGASLAPLKGRGPSHTSVGDLASDLASSIVGPLRDRLESAISQAGGDRDDLSKLIRTTFREWKGSRVDDAVEHSILAACNRGMLERLPKSSKVRWVVAESDAPSPDCEDNSLAGAVETGRPFPTGHLAPPLHPGCHCALLPADR